MSFTGVQLTLMIGQGSPTNAPAALMLALRSAEVTVPDDGSAGFQLTFQLNRSRGAAEYELLPYLAPWSRVVLVATIAGAPSVIADGLITNRQLSPGRGQPDTISVTGEDVSVAMDLVEDSYPYPGLQDEDIVLAVLGNYPSWGLMPSVSPSVSHPDRDPTKTVMQRRSTDRAYIRELASQNGYVFHVRPGPAPMTNIAYWGPPIRSGNAYPALSVQPLPVSAVESMQFTYDALAPRLVVGGMQDTFGSDDDIPINVLGPMRSPPLASQPAAIANLPNVYTSLFSPDEDDPVRALALAQAEVDRASDRVLVAQGEIDVFRYQTLLAMPGIVGVRGAGSDHDGYYYVSSVTHAITPTSYKQRFTLAREGLGTLVSELMP
jgi:hypothetical protein